MDTVLVYGSNSISDAIIDILNNEYMVYNIKKNSKLDEILKGNIIALINTANYNILAPFEELDLKEFRKVFNENFFNIAKLIKRVIPIMRKNNFGMIINIISVGGRVGFPMVSAYSSAQFALEGLCESLRYELDEYNIKVIVIEIGAVKGYLTTKVKGSNDEIYLELLNKIDEGLKILSEHGTDPKDIARLAIKILKNKESNFRYVIGNDASMLLESKKKLSDIEFERFMKEEILPED